ncbi:MAG: hypothetical protein ABI430_00985 [Candidatus Taylorbacteria bacterium]
MAKTLSSGGEISSKTGFGWNVENSLVAEPDDEKTSAGRRPNTGSKKDLKPPLIKKRHGGTFPRRESMILSQR